jgi:ATP-dependent Lon protease
MNKGLANQISNETEQEFKKMVIRKQIKTLNEKLYGSEEDPVLDYESKIEAKNLPEDAKKCALRELNKLRKSRGFDQDSSVTSNYLDFLLDLPWNDLTTDNLSLQNARSILEKEDH